MPPEASGKARGESKSRRSRQIAASLESIVISQMLLQRPKKPKTIVFRK
jgi:hypothetical protein